MEPPMERVTANVYANTRIRGCNPSYVVTSDGVVVIDTPQLPTKAVAMRQEAESHGPIRYVINTEHHVDHIFGNYYFKGAGPVVHHKGVADNFMVVAPILDPFAYAAEAIPTDDPEGAAIFPDREEYYRDPNRGSHRLHRRPDAAVGETTFRLIHVAGHTPGQIAVHVPEEGVVFTGDTIFNQCQTWLMTSDVDGWLAALETHPRARLRSPGAGPRAAHRSLGTGRPARHPAGVEGRRCRRRGRGLSAARRRRRASTSRNAFRSTSVRST